ncbi:MKI67 FHA domain-interacting nucleolar phosphoprotein isoform X2 [Cydia pomonella]|uniref:MKI67 FHA domain-interacting nucleolar phosphoprotein isoform X2 n=1 Tax=Cydia pomonella TaxID=82600 RepID=UPI002ADD4359|nr:MKI67 FHA domain-interacting nucleolar phosphoprotein isoform X2 [Cydia pomonella]
MEENVALDSTKQRKFNKSIKGIKKLLKKKEDKPHKPAVLAPKDDEGKKLKEKKKRPDRGLVYLSHIPHGFYEHEMTQYFKQFGMVTNVRVIRSPRTGRSKGYAFVEFREPAVAEIVAETMNNYLMGKRLIKAAIIPPEKQKHKAFRKYWSTKNNPTAHRRIKERKAHNAEKTDAEHLKKAKKMLLNLRKTKKKLNDLGIDYDFFNPVDVPVALLENAKVKSDSEGKAVKIKNEAEEKQNKKKKINAEQTTEKPVKEKKPETKKEKSAEGKSKKDVKKPQESDKAKQNEKQKKMQAAGVKLPENFIQIAEEAEDSDSSLDFDSDEYEKMLANDSDASSGDESDEEDDDNEEEESDDEESEEEIPELIPIKQKEGKKPLVALPPPKQASKPANGPKAQNSQPPQPKKGPKPVNVTQGSKKTPLAQPGAKRKNLQPEVSPKKSKFAKNDKKPRNKQFRKKNKA